MALLKPSRDSGLQVGSPLILMPKEPTRLNMAPRSLFGTRSGTTIARQVWVANVEMAISIAKVACNNSCTQETLILLPTPLLKTSTHLRNKEVHFHTPSMHTGTPTLKQPRNTTPCHSARYPRLSKSPYCYSHTHQTPFPLSKQQSLLPMRIHQPCDAMNKTLQQVFPTATPTTDLRPYDKFAPTFTGFIIE